ncbi:lysophospholipid acyltransferase family protein [bacterium]|nr:lysophospholipid acyltransferase family protein [bacterium]
MSYPKRKALRYSLETSLLLACMLAVNLMSHETALKIADAAGWILFHVLKIRRRVTLDNIAWAFPDRSEKARREIALGAYRNMCRTAFEFILFPQMKLEHLISRSSFRGKELLDEALAEGRGAVLLTGHFGNWEWFGGYLSRMGYPVSFLVKEQHNKATDRIMNRIRAQSGAEIIYLGMAVREVLRALRRNRFVAIVGDQDAGPGGIMVDFFGRPTSTAQGAALFSLKTGAPVLFGYGIRTRNGRHAFFGERLKIGRETGTGPEAVRPLLQAYSARLESAIRAHPEQWFWMHRRWKSSPEPPQTV